MSPLMATTRARTTSLLTGHRHGPEGERGASLILALVFILVVAGIVAAIASMALNDLNNTGHFDDATALDYAASGAADVAIQSVRTSPLSATQTPEPCWTSSSTLSELNLNNATVAVWCTTVSNPGSSQSRIVTMYACEESSNYLVSASQCEQDPLLTVVEAYDDYSPLGTDTCLTNPSSSTCGFGASTLVWKWGSLATTTGGILLNAITITSAEPANPTVGGNYTPAATATSGDQVSITTSSSACTITDNVVNFVAPGNCTLNFNDPGNFNYAPAPELSQSFTVSS